MITHPTIGQRVTLWYAGKWQAFGAPHHGKAGTVEIRARGPGPRNHRVRLDDGRRVVVPCGNIRPLCQVCHKPGCIEARGPNFHAGRSAASIQCDYTGRPPFADAEWKDDPSMCQWCGGTGHPFGDESYQACAHPALAATTTYPPVLDACCGPRMMWFDKADDRALFVDKRRERCHADTREGRREIVVEPDQVADFRALPFPDATFTLVVFDPPHTFAGPNGWTRKKYGTLEQDWREDIRHGFAECFRVLCPLGTLVFKWCEHRVPIATVLALTPERPLFGQRCGTTAKTHWIVFMKQNKQETK